MADRYSSEFRILTKRQPVKGSPDGSILRAISGAVKNRLSDLTTSINTVYDSKLIITASGDVLDKWGETMNLTRNTGETDTDYRNRLLIEFRNIPEGLTLQSLNNAVSSVVVPQDIIEWYQFRTEWPLLPEAVIRDSYFGYYEVGPVGMELAQNLKAATRYYLPVTTSVDAMYAYLQSDSGCVAYAAIYANSGGLIELAGIPFNKIADADASLPVTALAPGAWYKFTFTPNVDLTGDQEYWLCINIGGGNVTVFRDNGEFNQTAGRFDTPPPSDPFGDVQIYYPYKLSFFATYPPYGWQKLGWFNDFESKYYVSVVFAIAPSPGQLDEMEENIRNVKPAHTVVWLVTDETSYHDLLREIL